MGAAFPLRVGKSPLSFAPRAAGKRGKAVGSVQRCGRKTRKTQAFGRTFALPRYGRREGSSLSKEAKTNAMRMLERAKVAYTAHEYPHEEGTAVDGATVAKLTGQDPARVFKTLVTQGADRCYYVFVVPVLAELDLKKAAKAVGVKSVTMIHVAEINKITGYVRGGCSPVGMKKQFVTVFDESCLAQNSILVSGGRIGTQIEAAPAELVRVTRGKTAAIAAAPAGEGL